MTSAINPAYPSATTPTTQSVRDNFQAAKNEIDALQAAVASSGLSITATGTVGDGTVVVLRSDGTVEAAGEVSVAASFGAADTTLGSRSHLKGCYNATENKIVFVYQNAGDSKHSAVVGTVSGTSISFGAATLISGTNSGVRVVSVAGSKVVFGYTDSAADYAYAVVGTISGTGISMGTPVQFNGNISTYISSITYDSTNDRVVIAYQDSGNSNYGTAIVGTVSGTSISFGSEVVFKSGSVTGGYFCGYDSVSGKIVIAYADANDNNYGKAIIGTVSGTSISFGTAVTYNSAYSGTQVMSVVPVGSSKVVIGFTDYLGGSEYGKAVVGTISGTSISFGALATIATKVTAGIIGSYGSEYDKVVFTYNNHTDYDRMYVVGTVSGTTISFDTPIIIDADTPTNSVTLCNIYHPTANQFVIAYGDESNSNLTTVKMLSLASASTNIANWLGISKSAVTNAAATVAVVGDVVTNQSGLTTGATYYLTSTGTLSTTVSAYRVGRALSSTKLIIERS